MTLEERAQELSRTLRICAGRGGCPKCPLNDYVGCCSDRLKRDSAEMLEDQQAVIRSLMAKIDSMTAAVQQLMDKYSGGSYEQEED